MIRIPRPKKFLLRKREVSNILAYDLDKRLNMFVPLTDRDRTSDVLIPTTEKEINAY